VTLEGFKIEDVDGDGIANGTDHGLAGWTIYWDSNGNGVFDAGEPSAVTDESGHYALTVAEHEVGSATAPREDLKPGWIQTGAGPSSGCSFGTSHSVPCFYDFLNFKLGTVAGTKFEDHNGDGIRDAIDQGLAGWTIQLIRLGGFATLVGTRKTDAAGHFMFTGLL